MATLVGQNLGAQQPQRAEQSVWTITRYNLIFMISVALVFIAFAPHIIGLFSNDAEVLTSGSACLRMVAYGYGFFAVGMILVQAFNGAGDTMTPTKINFCCYWLLQIPLAWLLAEPASLQAEGVYIAILVAESVLAIAGYLIFRKGNWKAVAV